MCDKYRRPLSEILELPGYDLEWASVCFSIDDDLRDPQRRKALYAQPILAELSTNEAKDELRKRLM